MLNMIPITKLLITLYSILITLFTYNLSRRVNLKHPSPLTTPVFFTASIIMLLLFISQLNFNDYQLAKDIISYPLGAATVALAVPLYKNKEALRKYFVPMIIGILIGSFSTMISTIIIAEIFQLSQILINSLSVKSVTVAIAVEIVKILGGDISLTAVFVMVTGIIGAMIGPKLMSKVGINHPISRGLAIGTISHGIGTAQIINEGELQGAVSGIAMVVAGIIVSFMAPIIIPFLL